MWIVEEEAKIDIHNSEKTLQSVLKRCSGKKLNNRKSILDYDKQLTNKGRSVRRRIKVLNHLKSIDSWFGGKSFDKLTHTDLQDCLERLQMNQIVTIRGVPYKERTKQDYCKIFRQFGRWLFTKSEYERKFEGFTYTIRGRPNERIVFPLDVITKIAGKAPLSEWRTAIMVLFISGARPEEFANVRWRDIEWDEKKKVYWIDIRFEKGRYGLGGRSFPRKVDLPHCTDVLKSHIAQHRKEPGQPAFDINMDSLRNWLGKYSKDEMNFSGVNIYTLRRSAVAFWGPLYRWQLDPMRYRFGWTAQQAAKEIETYMPRTKDTLALGSELAHQEKIVDLTQQNEMMHAEVKALKDQFLFWQNQMMSLAQSHGKNIIVNQPGGIVHNFSPSGDKIVSPGAGESFVPSFEYYNAHPGKLDDEKMNALKQIHPDKEEVADLQVTYFKRTAEAEKAKKR